MRYVIALGVVALCALPFVARGPVSRALVGGPTCESLVGTPSVEVVLGMPEVEIDDTRTREAITAIDMKSRNLAGYARSGWVTNGLTLSNLRSGVRYTTRQVAFRNGSGCATVDRAEIHIGFDKPVRILLPNRYPEGTCARRALLDHEQQHVQINSSSLAASEPRFRNAVLALGPAFPIHADDVEDARAQAEAVAAEAIEAVRQSVLEEITARNAAIDTEASYRSLQALCSDW
jgi:hypothetical protein